MRNSERQTWLRCRQQHQWGYGDRLKPKIEAPHFRFGTLIHAALEQRYPEGTKRGPHPTATFKKLYDAELKKAMGFGFKDEDDTWQDARDVGIAMMDGYIDLYGTDSDYEVIASEQTFKTPVLYRGRRIAWYVGTFDGVWKHKTNKRLVIKDYKTTKSDPTKNSHLVLDEQATTYMSFGADYLHAELILPKGVWPSHMLYTFMRKGKPDERPQNAAGHYLNNDGSVSKKQPSPLFHREIVYRDEATRKRFRTRAAIEILEMQESAVYKAPGKFTCNMCEFADMCELHEAGADYKEFAKAVYSTWDPYAAHEIEDAERV